MSTASPCVPISVPRAPGNTAAPPATANCETLQPGTYIDGGDGDDRIIISGDHRGERIVVEGGAGQDRVIVTGASDGRPGAQGAARSSHGLGLDAGTIVILTIIVAALIGFVLVRAAPK